MSREKPRRDVDSDDVIKSWGSGPLDGVSTTFRPKGLDHVTAVLPEVVWFTSLVFGLHFVFGLFLRVLECLLEYLLFVLVLLGLLLVFFVTLPSSAVKRGLLFFN